MTNYEILQKSIINAGINSNLGCWAMVRFLQLKTEPEIEFYFQNKEYYAIIFDINFAKGFWGDDWVCEFCGELAVPNGGFGFISHENLYCVNPLCQLGYEESFNKNLPRFEYHIRQMALEKEPLKYIEQFLGEK